WTQITVDEELGLVYLPVESPSSDYYGGKRPGNNLFGESLVCVDLKTGQRKWHFQLVHHPIWDHDISSAPILLDVTIDGKPRKLVAQPSKQSFLYVFARVPGEPIWPIVETKVPPGDVPGEWYSPTQPIPSKPPAYGRPGLRIPDELIDFTPDMRTQAVENMKRYKWGGDYPYSGTLYNPPIVGDIKGLLGALNLGNASGGTNWPGAGGDPEGGEPDCRRYQGTARRVESGERKRRNQLAGSGRGSGERNRVRTGEPVSVLTGVGRSATTGIFGNPIPGWGHGAAV